MRKYDKQFKASVMEYVYRHKDLTVYECSKVFGVGYSTLAKWLHQERLSQSSEANISLEQQKEILRLQQELKETQKTLKVLKEAFSLLGK